MAELTLFPPAPLALGEAPRPTPDPLLVTKAPWMEWMKPAQIDYWHRVLASTPNLDDLDVEVYVGMEPAFTTEIFDQHLYNEHGLFQFSVLYEKVPRVATLLRLNGTAVAHALLEPTTVGKNYSAQVPPSLGHKAGIVGAYVAEAHRGNGYARRCIEAVAKTIAPALRSSNKRVKFCMTAEARIVPWCKELFSIPVIARWANERHEETRLAWQRH